MYYGIPSSANLSISVISNPPIAQQVRADRVDTNIETVRELSENGVSDPAHFITETLSDPNLTSEQHDEFAVS